MSHELEMMQDGRYAMMYVQDWGTPWHTLGQPVARGISVREAIVKSGLNWSVGLLPHCIATRKETDKWNYPEGLVGTRVPRYSTFRIRENEIPTEDDILGEVGPNYTPLQNIEAFDFFQPFIDSGEAELDTAGSIFGGQKVWILARLMRDPIVIRGVDTIAKNILISNSHDGTTAARVGFTPIRTVCWNTLSMAHNSSESCLIRLRHCSSIKTNLEDVREIMNTANAQFEATSEQYKFLASKEINRRDLQKYVKLVLKIEDDENGEIHKKTSNILEGIYAAFEASDGTTYWDAYNSVNRRFVWDVGRNQQNRIHSLWFGPNAEKNARALNVAVEMASAI